MKSAEVYIKAWNLPEVKTIGDQDWKTSIEVIQLDAFKAGAEWAAKICFDVTTSRMIDKRNADGAFDCQKSIEIASSNLKEIPK